MLPKLKGLTGYSLSNNVCVGHHTMIPGIDTAEASCSRIHIGFALIQDILRD